MKECIILAGGLGTRLQSVVNDVPKCMATVAGKPFLHYILDYLSKQGFRHIVLSLGYKAEIVIGWLKENTYPFSISYVIEETPLGTGGAIRLATGKISAEKVFVINGDTFFGVDTEKLIDCHTLCLADISIALKPMTNFDRYGSVEMNSNSRIIRFNEKHQCAKGLINGGIYLINKAIFERLALPEKFSFEKDVLEKQIDSLNIVGSTQDSYFIDIGIPSDYLKANSDFANDQ